MDYAKSLLMTKEWKVSHDSSCEMKRGLYLNLEMILAFLSLGKWNLFPTCDEHGKKNKTSTAKEGYHVCKGIQF